MIKQYLKKIIGTSFSNLKYPIIINSYGRSGSTVLTNSIIKSAIKIDYQPIHKIISRSISQSAWNLEKANLKKGIVYKTHDYPPTNMFNNEIRMIYPFANPVDVVLSLLRLYEKKGEAWMKRHYKNLKVSFDNFENIVHEDQLRLENHLNSWLQESRFPIAFVKYESMWDHKEDISSFLGSRIELPSFRKRKAKDRDEKRMQIKKTYRSLINKIERLDSFFTNFDFNGI